MSTVSYGIHTMDAHLRLTGKQAKAVRDICYGSGAKTYLDESYTSHKGIQRLVWEGLQPQGVLVYLHYQKQSKNKTDKKVPGWLILRVNLHTVSEGYFHPRGTGRICKQSLDMLEVALQNALVALGVGALYPKLTLSRVDVTADIWPMAEKELRERLRLYRRSPIPRQMTITGYSKKTAGYKEKNLHSIRSKNDNATFTIYDKGWQLLEESIDMSCFLKPYTMRVEVALKSKKIGQCTKGKVGMRAQLKSLWRQAPGLLWGYLKQLELAECYGTYAVVNRAIETSKNTKKMKARMLSLLKACRDFRSYQGAVEACGMAPYQGGVERQFRKLGISPIPLRKDCGFKRIEGLCTQLEMKI